MMLVKLIFLYFISEKCFFISLYFFFCDRDIGKLKENFAIVRPVCLSCYNKGMQPATRNAKKNKTTKDKLTTHSK